MNVMSLRFLGFLHFRLSCRNITPGRECREYVRGDESPFRGYGVSEEM